MLKHAFQAKCPIEHWETFGSFMPVLAALRPSAIHGTRCDRRSDAEAIKLA